MDLLQTLLLEFQDKISNFTGGVPRHVSFPTSIDKIFVAIGMRRTGKTYFLFQTIQKIIKDIPLSRVLYINFDDERLLPMSQKEFGELIDDFYTLYPENHDQECYLFFDEIQNVDQWERVIRRFYDTKKVKIYLTGSSAKLLSKEIDTSLRGRSFPLEIWPFSFEEFQQGVKGESAQKLQGKKTLDKQKNSLKLYIDRGGFPEVVSLGSIDFRSVLQDYVSAVILRDIVERYNIANASIIHYMVKVLLGTVGCGFSVAKFYNDLKSQGKTISKDSLYAYLDYIRDSYLAFTVSLYDESIRKRQSNPRKVYAVDTGLVNAYSFGRSQNIGHYFENLIYLDLRRARYEEICYYLTKSRKEVDFMARDGFGQWHLYQVCWDMRNDETMKREISALQESERELGIKGEIITPDSYFLSFLPSLKRQSLKP